jgi:hypothetical protein
VFAITFILFLAVMSLLFATSEILPKAQRLVADAQTSRGPFRKASLFWTHLACTVIILVAGAWAFFGVGVWELTRLYIGEVASVWAFAISWLVAGFYLTAPARTKPRQAAEQA